MAERKSWNQLRKIGVIVLTLAVIMFVVFRIHVELQPN